MVKKQVAQRESQRHDGGSGQTETCSEDELVKHHQCSHYLVFNLFIGYMQ